MTAGPLLSARLSVDYANKPGVLDGFHLEVAPGEIGALVVKLPLPPGTLPTLWQNDARYKESYLEEFPGYYKTADAGFIDEDGYVFVTGRLKELIIKGGENIAPREIDEAVYKHPAVLDAAVRNGGPPESRSPPCPGSCRCPHCRATGPLR